MTPAGVASAPWQPVGGSLMGPGPTEPHKAPYSSGPQRSWHVNKTSAVVQRPPVVATVISRSGPFSAV